MQTKDNLTQEEAKELAESLIKDDNTVDFYVNKDDTYRLSWIKNKKYTALDGKEYTDEVWTTIDYKMICIQDLSEDHAKNIIRMMLRNEREAQAAAADLADRLSGIIESVIGSSEVDEPVGKSQKRILH